MIDRLGIPARRVLALAVALVAGLALSLLPLPWPLLAVPGGIALGLTLIRPSIALYLLCFAVPFGSLFEVEVGGITVGVTEGLIGLLLAAWIARSIVLPPQGWRWPPLSAPLAFFLWAAMLSLTNATALPLALKEIAKWVEVLGVMLFVVNALSERESRAVAACLLLSGVAQALLGAYQFFAGIGPEFFRMGRFMRAYGTFEQPNPYGGYLGQIAPLAFALGLSALARPASRRLLSRLSGRWLQVLALGSFVLISAAIGMSGSRGAWLAFALAFAATNLVRSRKGAVLFVTLIALVALLAALSGARLLPRSIEERLTSFLPFLGVRDVQAVEITDENYASVERLAFWQAALAMWRDHLWLGVGFGNYQAAYAQYALPKWPQALGHAHNYYLNVAAEMGLIGLVAYLALWGAAFWQIARALRSAPTAYARALALGALGMLVHVSAHNVVDNLWVHNMYIQVAIVLGLAYASRHAPGSADRQPVGLRPREGQQATALVS